MCCNDILRRYTAPMMHRSGTGQATGQGRRLTMRLQGKTVGVFVAEGFEDLEFWVPVMRLREEGARVLVIGLSRETVTGKHCLTATPETGAGEGRSGDLGGLVNPGGGGPDHLRPDRDVLRIVAGG